MVVAIQTLEDVANAFLRKEYGLTLEIPIVRNNRLKRSQGRYIETYDEKTKSYVPGRIEISGEMFEYAAVSALIDTLKHELVHYALAVKGEPNDDGHPHFETELRRVCAPSTGTAAIGKYALYRCNKCGELNISGRKSIIERLPKSTIRYSTRCCKASLTYIDTVILDGTKSVKE